MDPFATIGVECGTITSSQESLLLRSRFLNDTNPSPDEASSPPATGSLAEADAPILICTLPSSPSPADARDLGLPASPILASPISESPPPRSSNRFKKRTRGAKLRTPEPEDELDAYRCQSLDILKDLLGTPRPEGAAVGGRKLPPSFMGPAADKGNRGADFPRNLADAMELLCEQPDRRYASTDILDIAAMKGIVFPNPKWWRPGGYEAKKDKGPAT